MPGTLRRLLPILLIPLYAALFFAGAAAAAEAASGRPLEIVSAVERTLDGRPALALIFSQPLDTGRRYDGFIGIVKKAPDKKTGDEAAGEPVDGAWVLAENRRMLLFAAIEPKTTYRLRVVAGLTAAGGAVLAAPFTADITTRALEPAFGFASRGSVLPARLTGGLPILTVNVPEVDVQFLRVRPEKLAPFMKQFHWTGGGLHWDTDLDPMHVYTESVHVDRFQTHGEANTRTVTHIPVEEIGPLQQPGLYIAIMSRPNRFGKFKTSHFYVSDIGLHLHRHDRDGAQGGMTLIASSLTDGTPLEGVAVELADAEGVVMEKGFTDAQGHLLLQRGAGPDLVLIARRGGHLAILPFREPALDLSEFAVSGPPQQDREVFIHGPRDLYRPGEAVTAAFLLRDQDGRAVAPQPLTVLARRPGGRVMSRRTLQPAPPGHYQWRFNLPQDAPTGQWQLEARLDPGDKQPAGRWSFHVEAFLPERMKLTPDSAQTRLAPGEPFQVSLEGAYLYGAPAAGNRLKAVLNLHPQPHPLAAWPEHFFGDMDDPLKAVRREIHDGPMDAKGRLALAVTALKEPPRSPLSVRVTASLFEAGGRPVTRSIARTLWPAEALVGVRPLFEDDAPGDSTVRFEIIRVRADGSRPAVADTEALEATVIREDRDYYWSFDEERGWEMAHSDAHYPVSGQALTLPADGSAILDVAVAYGAYRLEIDDPATGLKTRYRFYAGWNGRDRDAGAHARPDRVSLGLDRAAYLPGETARLRITPPHAGEAVIMLEADRPLWRTRLTLPAEGAEVAIPLDKGWNRHDLYLSVVVLRPGSAAERTTPNRALGLIHLPLQRDQRRLPLTIEAPGRIEPDRPVTVNVHLEGFNATKEAPAWVTLAAVDVGILNITGFATPDPFGHFFGKRRYGAEIRDLYGKVIENLAGKRAGMRYGGDAATKSRGQRPHAQVRSVALFSGPVAVNEQGVAEIPVTVPDFNGALRLMAVAFTDDRFGAAEAEMIVAAPLIAQLAAPRFLAAGDRTWLTLDLTNTTDEPQTARMTLEADGPLAVEAVSREVTLEKGEKSTLRFPLGAKHRFGTGHIRLGLQGDGIDLARSWPLSVRPAYPGERRVQRFQLTTPSLPIAVSPERLKGLIPATTEVEMRISTRPPINFGAAVRGLLEYPYGCLEQTVSRAYPLLYVDKARAARLELPEPLTRAERAERLEQVFSRLVGMQRAGGGFGLWRSEDPEERWLTPYVADFLLDARAAGFAIPEEMLDRTLARLHKQFLARGGLKKADGDHAAFAADAYTAHVLARVGRAPLSALRTLHDQERQTARSGLPLVHLGLALHLQGDARRGDEALAEGVARERPGDLYLDDYGSAPRDTALIISLLARHGRKVAGDEALLHRLDRELSGHTWWSTQERHALFMVSELYPPSSGEAWEGILKIGDMAPVRHPAQGDLTLRFTPKTLDLGITFAATDAGEPKKLFGVIETTGAGVEPPPPKADLITIERTLHTMAGKPVGKRPLRVGELLLTHLRVVSADNIPTGLVVDLLPAGLEIENLNLSQGETLGDVKPDGIQPAVAMADARIRHLAFLDDRFAAAVTLNRKQPLDLFYLVRVVTPGIFRTPPPLAEEMYRPDRYGVGATPGPTEILADPPR